MIDFTTIIAVAGAIVMASRLVLIAIAPLTKNKIDDNILAVLNYLALHIEKK